MAYFQARPRCWYHHRRQQSPPSFVDTTQHKNAIHPHIRTHSHTWVNALFSDCPSLVEEVPTPPPQKTDEGLAAQTLSERPFPTISCFGCFRTTAATMFTTSCARVTPLVAPHRAPFHSIRDQGRVRPTLTRAPLPPPQAVHFTPELIATVAKAGDVDAPLPIVAGLAVAISAAALLFFTFGLKPGTYTRHRVYTSITYSLTLCTCRYRRCIADASP